MNGPVTREELWELLRSAGSALTTVFGFLPAELLSHLAPDDREDVAQQVGRAFRQLPGLTMYCRIGMYDFGGVTTVDGGSVLEWGASVEAVDGHGVRWAVARAGDGGLNTFERLMVGANEESNANPHDLLFEMGDDGWVRSLG